MPEPLRIIALVLYLVASAGLLAFGLNCYLLLCLYLRRAREAGDRQREVEADGYPADLPTITSQLPLYNELNVAERVIRAVAAFDYPADKHQIQVLDDSTDETRDLVDRVVAELRATGVRIEVIRRQRRHGYKAGALDDAMPRADGEFIAIFDSDFVPAPDFLLRMLPHTRNPRTGLVQARWTHLNRRRSLLTRAQSIGIDGHFLIEQTARCANGLFLNFNGTAGIWRKSCIEDAGGWAADTLTEDLDLSYRAQLKGWHLEYVPGVEVPAELPESYTAFKSQQFRWAKGSLQTAMKLCPAVLGSDRSPLAKLQACFHLCGYLVHPLMLVVALLALPALHELRGGLPLSWLVLLSTPLLFAALGPSILYTTCQRVLYPGDWLGRVALLPVLMLIGFGICISNTRAIAEAFLGIRSGFVRTPKTGGSTGKSYRTRANWLPFAEISAGIYAAWTFGCFANSGNLAILPFLSLYIAGFSLVGWSSLGEQLRQS